jgi:hypothetical protein
LSADTQRYLQLLEKRIDLMQSLADSLAIANSSLLTFDLDNLESAIQKQEELSLTIRALDADITQVQMQCKLALQKPSGTEKSSGTPGSTDAFRGSIERLARVQDMVRTLNDRHLLLVARSMRF